MINRVLTYLSRHRSNFKDEELFWVENNIKRAFWKLQSCWQHFTLPPDRANRRTPLGLEGRCIRALSVESTLNDDRLLELDPPNEQEILKDAKIGSAMAWTSSDILGKCGIYVYEEKKLYVHSQTDVDRFGFAYGSIDEVEWRCMYPIGKMPKKRSIFSHFSSKL